MADTRAQPETGVPTTVGALDAAAAAMALLERRAARQQLSEPEVAALDRAFRRLLGEAASVAHHVLGGLPPTWAHYISARRAFASDAQLAEVLGVSRSRVARWKQGETPDSTNEAKLRDLDIAVTLLSGYLDDRAIPDWLRGANPQLNDRRPVDVLMSGRLSEVIAAIEAEKSGAFA